MGIGDTQTLVATNVREQGYDRRKDGTPWTSDEMAARQVLKALSDAVEALQHVKFVPRGDISILFDAAESLGAMANFVFGNEGMCVGATIDDIPAFLTECADMMIPMLTAFVALGEDADSHVILKSGSDIERGVMGATGEMV